MEILSLTFGTREMEAGNDPRSWCLDQVELALEEAFADGFITVVISTPAITEMVSSNRLAFRKKSLYSSSYLVVVVVLS